MRSRYSAYATVAMDYILETTHPTSRHQYSFVALESWAKENQWLGLEILSIKEGGLNDLKGFVEFKASYMDVDQKKEVHHEYSTFVKENGIWFFVSGRVY
jgi:SEC-C motif-containing protein